MYDSTYDSAATFGLLGAYFLFIVILYAITAFPMMKIFQKAGAPGVAAWVPFWNSWVFFEVAGMKGFWGLLPLLGIIPFVNFITVPAMAIFTTIAAYNIALGFRKDSPALWTVLYFFFAPVWLWILALNGDRWQTVRGTNAILFQEEKYQGANGGYPQGYGPQAGYGTPGGYAPQGYDPQAGYGTPSGYPPVAPPLGGYNGGPRYTQPAPPATPNPYMNQPGSEDNTDNTSNNV